MHEKNAGVVDQKVDFIGTKQRLLGSFFTAGTREFIRWSRRIDVPKRLLGRINVSIQFVGFFILVDAMLGIKIYQIRLWFFFFFNLLRTFLRQIF